MASRSQPSGAREPISRAAPNAEPSGAFTPGPWAIESGPQGGFAVWAGLQDADARNAVIVCSRNPIAHRAEESIANARLIAAAPDLLEALKALTGNLGSPGGIDRDAVRPQYDAALAAIAKAEGK